MRVTTLCLAALALSGCFRFDDKLKACRNDAGTWICGDAGAAGGTGGGGGGEGEFAAGPATEFQCFGDGGWCWEHPRPAGGRFRSVWASGPNDLWIGTAHGLVLHRNGDGWRTTFLAQDLSVEAICGKNGVVYAGGDYGSRSAQLRLFAIDPATGVATALGNSTDDIFGMDCGLDRLWVAHTNGAWSVDYDTKLLSDVSLSLMPNEMGVGVTSPGAGRMLLLTGPRENPGSSRVIDETNTTQFTYTPTGDMAVNFAAADIWRAGDGTVQVGYAGNRSGELWALDGGSGELFWPIPFAPTPQVYDGAAWGTGSIAVGSRSLVVETQNGVATTRTIDSFGNNYHSGVMGLPGGEAFIVGEPGCLLERRSDGGWSNTTNCDRFIDFSLGLEDLAVSDDTLYRRQDAGWTKLETITGLYGVWTNPADAGRALLKNDALTYNGAQRSWTFSEARDLVVLDDARAVVLLDDGSAIDTSLTSDVDGGIYRFSTRPRMVVDPTTRTFWAFELMTTKLWSSSAPGVWTQVDAGVAAEITDLSAGFGHVWLTAGDSVYVGGAGAWVRIPRSGRAFQRVIALDASRAITFEYARPAEIFLTDGSSTNFDFFPFDPVLSAVRGDEVWVLGAEEGLIRRALPQP